MHRRLVFITLLLVTFLMQVIVAPEISIGKVKPDLLVVVTVCLGLLEGPSTGALFGFWGGFLADVFSTSILGVSAFTQALVGFIAGELKHRIVPTSVIWPMGLVFLFSILNELVRFTTWISVGWDARPPFNFATIMGIALYNTLMTILAYPLTRRLAEREEELVLFK